MVQVAFVGNFQPPHSTENHLALAFDSLGHEVVQLQESGFDWTTLKQRCAGSDLFMWVRTAGYDADRQVQRAAVKSLDIPWVSYHLDRWWGLRRERLEGGPLDPDRSPFFEADFLCTADGGHDEEWASIGANHLWFPPAVLKSEAERVGQVRSDYQTDVGFCGNLRAYGHYEWREYRRALHRFLTQTYGRRFKLWEGGIRGQDLADLYASVRIMIGDSCLVGNGERLPGGSRGGISRYWSDRIPETLGRGGFLIHPEVEGLIEEYPYLPLYPLGDFQRLRELIDYYLDHEEEREDIAALNRQHVLENHLYEHRLERILTTVLG